MPTCSYRMGVKEIALGLVVLDTDTAQLTYHNLWLPSRFALLYLYAVAVPICALFLFIGQQEQAAEVEEVIGCLGGLPVLEAGLKLKDSQLKR